MSNQGHYVCAAWPSFTQWPLLKQCNGYSWGLRQYYISKTPTELRNWVTASSAITNLLSANESDLIYKVTGWMFVFLSYSLLVIVFMFLMLLLFSFYVLIRLIYPHPAAHLLPSCRASTCLIKVLFGKVGDLINLNILR